MNHTLPKPSTKPTTLNVNFTEGVVTVGTHDIQAPTILFMFDFLIRPLLKGMQFNADIVDSACDAAIDAAESKSNIQKSIDEYQKAERMVAKENIENL